jgi:regulator of sigma E protease
MSVIIFFLVLFVLILVHEWGHFIAAKKTGMRVDEFGIGFPPKLIGKKKGETEYTLNALPIGGFVRIYGENADAVADTDTDKSRAFGSRPKWAQAVVLVAGVTMNVIFAWFLFFITFVVGVPMMVEESAATDKASLYVSAVLPKGPLDGKLLPNSIVTKLEAGEADLINPTPSTFTNFVQENAEADITVHYRLGEKVGEVTVTPVKDLTPELEGKAAVGVALSLVETKSYSVQEAISAASISTYKGLINITVGLFSLIADSVQGTADFSQVAGPVGIVGMVGDAADFGMVALLTFTAIISLNLAVINMLPIPALDGGRLLFVLIEAVTKRPINPIWAGRVNLIGFVLLMILMVVVTYNDILRLLGW